MGWDLTCRLLPGEGRRQNAEEDMVGNRADTKEKGSARNQGIGIILSSSARKTRAGAAVQNGGLRADSTLIWFSTEGSEGIRSVFRRGGLQAHFFGRKATRRAGRVSSRGPSSRSMQ